LGFTSSSAWPTTKLFQREIHEKIPDLGAAPATGEEGAKGKKGPKGRSTGNPQNRNRKQVEENVTDSDDSEVLEPDNEELEEEEEDVVVYVPTGTKSRPKN